MFLIPQTIDEALAQGAVAFVGEAVDARDVGYPDDGEAWRGPVRWTFEVESVVKGAVHQQVEVGSGRNSGDCGIDFANRGRVGVIATAGAGGLETGLCGGVWDADELIAAVDQVTPPLEGSSVPAPPPPPNWWLWGGGAVVFVAALFGLDRAFRKRRGWWGLRPSYIAAAS